MAHDVDNFNNAIATLDSLNRENATEMWVPSLERFAKFKPLVASNQRDMIATLAGSRYFPAALSITTYDVVRDTCVDSDITTGTLNSIDKLAIVLQLRAANIKETVSLQLDSQTQAECDKLNNGPFEKTVSIKSWVKTLKSKAFDLTPEVIDDGKLIVEVAMPTLESECRFQQQIYNISRVASTGQLQQTPEQILGHVFLNTICQYIKKGHRW